MSDDVNVEQFDEYLAEGSKWAAFSLCEQLQSVEGEDAPIFPPTFAKPEGTKDQDWSGYNIDRFEDGSSVCLVDSVGSQANRLEPVFKTNDLSALVPQIIIRAGDSDVNLLDAGHRAGDAIARFAGPQVGDDQTRSLARELWDAFESWRDAGNAEPLARIAPTSLVFGAWDSRATQAKLPRIVRSVIRGYGIRRLTRSAQYNPPLQYVDRGVIEPDLDKGEGEKNPLAREGFRHNPAVGSPGGILASEIRRDALINLVALRTLDVSSDETGTVEKERRLKLRRYILGLCLVAITYPDERKFNLREGCLLKLKGQSGAWKRVPFEGSDEAFSITNEMARRYAEATTKDFGPRRFERPFVFDSANANTWLKLGKERQDKVRRMGPVIENQATETAAGRAGNGPAVAL